MVYVREVEVARPGTWMGKVVIRTRDGRTLMGVVDEARGDPANTLGRPELEAKAVALASYAGSADAREMRRILDLAWDIRGAARVPYFRAA
jgi:hypothetical protein